MSSAGAHAFYRLSSAPGTIVYKSCSAEPCDARASWTNQFTVTTSASSDPLSWNDGDPNTVDNGPPYLDIFSLSFHSPTLAKGHTPYVQNDADLTAFWHWWEVVIETLDKLGVRPVRYEELERELASAP